MIITIDRLKELGACGTGIREFQKLYGDSMEVDWTLETQLQALKTNMKHWLGWVWEKNVVPQWSMMGLNLANMDLSHADLKRANLIYANLRGANLRYCDLREANLAFADFTGADLTKAFLSRTYALQAIFQSANLYGTCFRNAFLQSANFICAGIVCTDFSESNLRDAILTDVSQCNLTDAIR